MANMLTSNAADARGGNQDDIVIFGGSSSWQRAGALRLRDSGCWGSLHRAMRGCGTYRAHGAVRVAIMLTSSSADARGENQDDIVIFGGSSS